MEVEMEVDRKFAIFGAVVCSLLYLLYLLCMPNTMCAQRVFSDTSGAPREGVCSLACST